MTVIDEAIRANGQFAEQFHLGHLRTPPARKLVIVACMDSRMALEEMLGLNIGDAHMIRNAGGIVTEDVLRSLIISHHLLGTQEIMIINHTECGMVSVNDAELRARLTAQLGPADTPRDFLAFPSLEENVRRQVRIVREHPWISPGVVVRGFVYEVHSGRLCEVI